MLLTDIHKQTRVVMFIGQITFSFQQCRRQLTSQILALFLSSLQILSSFILCVLQIHYNTISYN